MTQPTLSTRLNELAHLSPEMAMQIGKAFGTSMNTLMRIQNSYDIAQAREQAGESKAAQFKSKPGGPQTAAVPR